MPWGSTKLVLGSVFSHFLQDGILMLPLLEFAPCWIAFLFSFLFFLSLLAPSFPSVSSLFLFFSFSFWVPLLSFFSSVSFPACFSSLECNPGDNIFHARGEAILERANSRQGLFPARAYSRPELFPALYSFQPHSDHPGRWFEAIADWTS